MKDIKQPKNYFQSNIHNFTELSSIMFSNTPKNCIILSLREYTNHYFCFACVNSI